MMPDRRFPNASRIKSPVDFSAVFDGRRSVRNRMVALYFRPATGSRARLGLSVGRRAGNAVRRNRIKRIWREVFRSFRDLLPGPVDLVVVPLDPVRCSSFAESAAAFAELAARLAKEMAKDAARERAKKDAGA